MNKKRLLKAAAVAMTAAAFFYLYLQIVELTGFMPRCLIKWATGWNCPGCGSQRAFMALIHGHPTEAIRANLILIPALTYLAVLFAAWIFPGSQRLGRIRAAITSPRVLLCAAATLILWMVIRNIAGC